MAYLVPTAKRRLLCPHVCEKQEKFTASFSIDGKESKLTLNGKAISSKLCTTTNLLLYTCMQGQDMHKKVKKLNVCITAKANQNLLSAQKELQRWHTRLGQFKLQVNSATALPWSARKGKSAKISVSMPYTNVLFVPV